MEGPAFYPYLSGEANLHRLDTANRHAPAATRSARVAAALERVGLSHAAHKKVRAYSLGMKQRLGIANALLTPRDLLVLDEPTNGLDPQGTREVRSLVRSLAAGGTTVFVSSHLLAEVEQMCTHAAVMSAGRLVAHGSLAELRSAGRAHVRVLTPDPGAARRELLRLGLTPDGGSGGSGLRRLGSGAEGRPVDARPGSNGAPGDDGEPGSSAALGDGGPGSDAALGDGGPGSSAPGDDSLTSTTGMTTAVVALMPDGAPAPETIAAALVAAGVRLRGFAVEEASLEDRFVALTGEGFDVAQ